MRIQTNVESLNAYRNLSETNRQQSTHMERLSSGFRINRAADDAAGLAISEQMRGQIGGLDQATENAQDATSLIQTAEGALNESHEILQRMRELSVQSANDTLTEGDRAEIQEEVNELAFELERISDTTEFNTQELLDGEFEGNIFHIGANEGQNIELSIDDMSDTALEVGSQLEIEGDNDLVNTDAVGALEADASFEATRLDEAVEVDDPGNGDEIDVQYALLNDEGEAVALSEADNGMEFHVLDEAQAVDELDELEDGWEQGETIDFSGADADGVGIEDLSTGTVEISEIYEDADENNAVDVTYRSGIHVDTQAEADEAITTIDEAIEQVSSQRSELGAVQNRLDHTVSNLEVASENLQAAESRIRDTDMAAEMTEFTTTQILEEAGTAMLAQANQAPQNVLQLLG